MEFTKIPSEAFPDVAMAPELVSVSSAVAEETGPAYLGSARASDFADKPGE